MLLPPTARYDSAELLLAIQEDPHARRRNTLRSPAAPPNGGAGRQANLRKNEGRVRTAPAERLREAGIVGNGAPPVGRVLESLDIARVVAANVDSMPGRDLID